MSSDIPQTEILNSICHLTAHRVAPEIAPSLITAALELTTKLFPHEPTAAAGLARAYQALISGDRRYEDCELLEYFIHTVGCGDAQSVVACTGLYRLIQPTDASSEILETLSTSPPASVSFLRGQRLSLEHFIWGGRLCIDRARCHSRWGLPFIIHHIFHTAQRILISRHLAPVLLAFTTRDDNSAVKHFYTNLGFEQIDASLEFAGATQDVFALNLTTNAPPLTRLATLTTRANREAS